MRRYDTEEQRLSARKKSQEKYKSAYPDRLKETGKRYRIKTKVSKLPNILFQAAKSRANRKGLDFNLTLDDLTIPQFCPVLGTPIDLEGSRDKRPSLDRVNNSKGYIKGNVKVISGRANRIKQDSSLEELEKLVFYVRSNK